MVKRAGLAILVCAVMVLVAAVPLVAGITITKGDKGPNASAVTWEYVPADYGVWWGHIENNGLRSLVVDVYDSTTGVPEEVMHQRIRFAAYDAFPIGPVDTDPVIMAAGHIYSITGTPNGPKGTTCVVTDMFKPAVSPVAMFTHTENYLVVNVDGSGSYDPDAITPPGIVSYSWNWGDMTMAGSGMTATHTYAMEGTYTITLTVTDVDGLTDDEVQTVTVYAAPPVDNPPVASFTATMDWMVVTVVSTSTDDKGIASEAWNFGDGATASGPTATHEYLTPGMWTITLTVTDTAMQTSTATKQVEAKMPIAPVASFTASMTWMTVNVDGSASSDADGTVQAWSWNWGDGSMAGSGATAMHKYAMPGTYTITLTVTDNDGLTGTATDTVTAQQAPPVASFTVSVNKRDVSVDGSGSSDPDGTIATWSWNWGDSSTLGSGAMATHRFMSVGTFTITLTVTDNDGLTASSSKVVTTSDSPPIASFTVTVNGLDVSVDASGSTDDYPGLTYAWNWGDGTTGTGMTATHTYAATPPVKVTTSSDGKARPPPPPFLVFGQTFDSVAGVILPGCTVEIKNMRTGAVNYTTSDALYGYYEYNLNDQGIPLEGDIIQVTATKGTMTGTATGTCLYAVGFVYLDIVLTGGVEPPTPYDVTITLTVTDAVGQTATVSKVVTVTPPAP